MVPFCRPSAKGCATTPGREAWKQCHCTAILRKNGPKMVFFCFAGAFCQMVRLALERLQVYKVGKHQFSNFLERLSSVALWPAIIRRFWADLTALILSLRPAGLRFGVPLSKHRSPNRDSCVIGLRFGYDLPAATNISVTQRGAQQRVA